MLSVAALLLLAACGSEDVSSPEEAVRPAVSEAAPAVAPAAAAVARSEELVLYAQAQGRLAPWRRATLSTESAGVIAARPVEEGSRVRAGAVLLRLSDAEARMALAEAEMALLEAQVAYTVLTRGTAEVPARTRAASQADSLLALAEAARQRGDLTERELEAARRRHRAQTALSTHSRDDVSAVTSGLSPAEQRLERARLALERTQLRAPFAGRVSDLRVEVGEHVAPGQPGLTLIDDTRMKVEVPVLEDVAVRLRQGAEAQVRIPALGGMTVRGQVYSINPVVDPETGMGRVTVAIPNPQGALLAGLHAEVTLETERLRDRTVVPLDAVLTRQDRPVVFRLESGRAMWVYVELGARSGDRIEIAHGITPGDTVLTGGHYALAHQAPVEVRLGSAER